MKRIFHITYFFLAACSLYAQGLGLVLSGGGAKGAYQVGVWKAMEEYGLAGKVRVASGTSVGALNAALFANVSPARAEQLWREKIGFLAVLTPDIGKVSLSADKIASFVKELQDFHQYASQRNLISRQNAAALPETAGIHPEGQEKGGNAVLATFAEGAKIGGSALVDYAKGFFLTDAKTPGIFSRESLARIIRENISSPAGPYGGWDFDVYATTVRKRLLAAKAATVTTGLYTDYSHAFHLNEQRSLGHVTQILLASSAIPIAFDSVTLPGDVILNGTEVGQEFEYIDGGFELVGGRNTPVGPLADRTDIDTVFVVYLKSAGELGEQRAATSSLTEKGLSVVEIVPSQPLGNLIRGTLNFSERQIQDLIDLGYSDAVRVLSARGYRKPGASYGGSSYEDDYYYDYGSDYGDYYNYYEDDDYYYDDGYDSYGSDDSYYDEDDYYNYGSYCETCGRYH